MVTIESNIRETLALGINQFILERDHTRCKWNIYIDEGSLLQMHMEHQFTASTYVTSRWLVVQSTSGLKEGKHGSTMHRKTIYIYLFVLYIHGWLFTFSFKRIMYHARDLLPLLLEVSKSDPTQYNYKVQRNTYAPLLSSLPEFGSLPNTPTFAECTRQID